MDHGSVRLLIAEFSLPVYIADLPDRSDGSNGTSNDVNRPAHAIELDCKEIQN